MHSTGLANPEGIHNICYHSNDVLNNTEVKRWHVVTVEGMTTLPEVGVNHKPLVALISAIILLGAGVWSSKKRPWKGGKDGMAVAKTSAIVSLPFILTEILTGALSFVTGELRLPPAIGVGTAVDLAILVAGLSVLIVLSRRSAKRLPGSEAPDRL